MLDRFDKFSIAISEISRYWHKLAADEMAKYGLKSAHAIYLSTMYRYPEGITVPRLCELCSKDKSDASRMLSILESKGLVVKQGVDGSLYRGLLVLTEDGKKAASHVCDKANRAVYLAGKDLTQEARDTFYKALESITANLRNLSKEGIPEA